MLWQRAQASAQSCARPLKTGADAVLVEATVGVLVPTWQPMRSPPRHTMSRRLRSVNMPAGGAS